MADAPRDKNFVPTNLDVSSVDFATPTTPATNPVTHARLVQLTTGLVLTQWDYMALVLTNATTETYTFRTGGSGGSVTNTIVIVYTDSGKGTISTVTKT